MENEPEKTLEQQLTEAEERGYRRGLNEQIEQKMQEPATWEAPVEQAFLPATPDDSFQILANTHKSIWD